MKAWVLIQEDGDYDSWGYTLEAVYIVPDDFHPETARKAFYKQYLTTLESTNPTWFRKNGQLKSRQYSHVHKAWYDHIKATFQSIPFIQ